MRDYREGYMDASDYYYELGEASGGNVVFPSLDDLLLNFHCAKSCGVVKVQVRKLVEVLPGEGFETTSFTIEEMENGTEKYLAYKREYRKHLEEKKKRLEALVARLGDLIAKLESEG